MSRPETPTNLDSASWETILTPEHPIRTSSLPAASTTTEPTTSNMEAPAIAAASPASTSPKGPYGSLIASAIQAASDAQEQMGPSSPLSDNSPVANSSVPRRTVDSIWPEPEAVSSAEADKDEGCGFKHLLWACVAGLNYMCCMT